MFRLFICLFILGCTNKDNTPQGDIKNNRSNIQTGDLIAFTDPYGIKYTLVYEGGHLVKIYDKVVKVDDKESLCHQEFLYDTNGFLLSVGYCKEDVVYKYHYKNDKITQVQIFQYDTLDATLNYIYDSSMQLVSIITNKTPEILIKRWDIEQTSSFRVVTNEFENDKLMVTYDYLYDSTLIIPNKFKDLFNEYFDDCYIEMKYLPIYKKIMMHQSEDIKELNYNYIFNKNGDIINLKLSFQSQVDTLNFFFYYE